MGFCVRFLGNAPPALPPLPWSAKEATGRLVWLIGESFDSPTEVSMLTGCTVSNFPYLRRPKEPMPEKQGGRGRGLGPARVVHLSVVRHNWDPEAHHTVCGRPRLPPYLWRASELVWVAVPRSVAGLHEKIGKQEIFPKTRKLSWSSKQRIKSFSCFFQDFFFRKTGKSFPKQEKTILV